MKYKTMNVVVFRRRSVYEASSPQYPTFHIMGAKLYLVDDYLHAFENARFTHYQILGSGTVEAMHAHVAGNGGDRIALIKRGPTRIAHRHGIRLNFHFAVEQKEAA